MKKDEQLIKDTIQTYFECMYESSSEKTYEAFHPNAKITGYMNEVLYEMSVDDFANIVAKQQPSPKDKGVTISLDVLSIEIAGDTAVARVRDDYLGTTYLDTLSLIKSDGKWCIYTKLFHVEKSTS